MPRTTPPQAEAAAMTGGNLIPAVDERPQPALRRLLAARVLLVAEESATLALVVLLAPIDLPPAPMLVLLALHGLLVFLQVRAIAAGDARRQGVFLHLLGDAVLVAALVYFSGGYTNPFISLLLLPLVLTAALLPAGFAWAMTGVVALLYTLLMTHYPPLRLDMTNRQAGDLHLTGRWLSFLFTAAPCSVS